METKKISKWDAAPESIKNMYEYVNVLYDQLPDELNPIIDVLSKVLDDYNELEAKYQKQLGMISDYEEERHELEELQEKYDKLWKKNVVLEDVEMANLESSHVELQEYTIGLNEDMYQLLKLLKENGIHVYDRKKAGRDFVFVDEDQPIADYSCLGIWSLKLPCNSYGTQAQNEVEIEKLKNELEEQRVENGAILQTIEKALHLYNIDDNETYCERTDRILSAIKDIEASRDTFWKKGVALEEVELARLKNKLECREEDINVLKEEKIMLASKNKALGMEICERNKQIHELKEENASLRKELEEQAVENRAILETIERSVGISEEMIDFISNDPYDSRVDRIITSIKRLEVQYDKLKEENDTYKEEILFRSKNKTITSLKEELTELRKNNEALQKELYILRRSNYIDTDDAFGIKKDLDDLVSLLDLCDIRVHHEKRHPGVAICKASVGNWSLDIDSDISYIRERMRKISEENFKLKEENESHKKAINAWFESFYNEKRKNTKLKEENATLKRTIKIMDDI